VSDLQRLINQANDKEIADLRAENASLRAALQRHDDIAVAMGEYPDLPDCRPFPPG